MNILKAGKKDFNKISKLIKSEFPYTTKNLEKIDLRTKKGNFIFVAKEKRVFFGFIEFKLSEFNANFLGMAVKKEFRRKGIGKKLFDFFIDFCKENEVKTISLIVKKDNVKAKKLYKSKGFIKVKELEKKIENSTIEVMQLNLGFNGVT
jgi:ribosomal protein S18 acetylase RimI-like enzyme